MKMMTNEQSARINALRVLCVILVLFIHILPGHFQPVGRVLSWQNAYAFMSEFFSHGVGRIAVPVFFILSGYLFFYNFPKKEGKWTFYKAKWKTRLRTIVIPYLLWNLLQIGAIFIKNVFFLHFGFSVDDGYEMITKSSVIDLIWNMPANFPLWYMRDLMCVLLICPVLGLGKNFDLFFLAIFATLYFCQIEIGIAGFGMTAFLFFGAGASCALHEVDIFSVPRKILIPALAAGIILIVLATMNNQSRAYECIIRSAIPLMVIALVGMVSILGKRSLECLSILSSSVFFVYASHEIYILNWTKSAFLKIFGDSVVGLFVGYFLKPAVVLSVCVFIFYFMRRIMPKTLAVLTGNRL